jgi:D-glycero-D-manno-heptose 1,7-bisphosphate phosphatase
MSEETNKEKKQMFLCPCRKAGVAVDEMENFTREEPYHCPACEQWKLFAEGGHLQVMPGKVLPALCLDLDGTVRYSKTGDFINHPEDVALFDGVEEKLWEYRREGFLILGITNQAGVAFGHKTQISFLEEIDYMLKLFEENPFHIVKGCLSHPDGKIYPYNFRSLLRKPEIGMLAIMEMEAFNHGFIIDWAGSLFIGDRPEDQECALKAGLEFQWAWDFFGREVTRGTGGEE